MAPKKAPLEEATTPSADNSAELDQAIDDLRGVLKADQTGATLESDFGTDFGSVADSTEFASAGVDDAFGGDFGVDTAFGGHLENDSPFGKTAFGGDSDFGDTSFSSSGGSAFSQEAGSGLHANMDLIKDIPLDVQIILGSSRMQVSGLMNLTEGAIIPLDRRIGEPVDLIVNGRLIGRGEITVLESDESRFGIRLLEVKSGGK